MSEEQENKETLKKRSLRPLYWIPMIWNGFTVLVFFVVGLTFLWGSRQPADSQVNLPPIILYFFTLFDLLMIISPLTLIVTVLMSVFNVMKPGTKRDRFLPLTFSAIVQGALTALFLASMMQPAGG